MPPLDRAYRNSLPPGRGKQQEHCGRVQQQRDDEDEPSQHHLVGLADEGGKISDGPEVGVDGATLAIHSGLLNLQVGECVRLDRELVGKAVALGLPSFVVRGAELEIGDVLKVLGTALNEDGVAPNGAGARRPCLRAPERQLGG